MTLLSVRFAYCELFQQQQQQQLIFILEIFKHEICNHPFFRFTWQLVYLDYKSSFHFPITIIQSGQIHTQSSFNSIDIRNKRVHNE